jgi:hypothetical protein
VCALIVKSDQNWDKCVPKVNQKRANGAKGEPKGCQNGVLVKAPKRPTGLPPTSLGNTRTIEKLHVARHAMRHATWSQNTSCRYLAALLWLCVCVIIIGFVLVELGRWDENCNSKCERASLEKRPIPPNDLLLWFSAWFDSRVLWPPGLGTLLITGFSDRQVGNLLITGFSVFQVWEPC